MKRVFMTLVVFFAAIVVQAQDSTVETTFDGLTKQPRGLFRESWVDLDVDFPQYTKIIPIDPYFEFRAVKRNSSAAARRSNQREHYISDSNRERLIKTVSEIFNTELEKSKKFTMVAEPGPDVAIIQVGVFDIVSRVPPSAIGRSEIYLASVGDATLVVELKDSLSLETIYRGVERRNAAQMGTNLTRANTVTNWAEVRRLARRWAITMRDGLDSIHE
ncbi:MAG: DUF3313 family protein [Woeseiaceae bacterium]